MTTIATHCWRYSLQTLTLLYKARASALARSATSLLPLVVGAISQCMFVAPSSAQTPYLGITVIPPIPTAQAPYQIRVNGVTNGGPLTLENIATTTSGPNVDVTYFIHNASGNVIAVSYEGTSSGPALAVGNYMFRYFLRLRFGDETEYRDPVLTYQKAVTVAPAEALTDAIEYYHPQMDHYFTTAFANEIALLDSGAIAGWNRTGERLSGVFLVNPTTTVTSSELAAVCRFYGQILPLLGTHFYSAFADECAAVSTMWPTQWLLETSSAYFVYPTSGTGQCPLGTVKVYRVFNNRPDANHRYTTSAFTRDAMVAAGWIAEGFGPDAVVMCTTSP